MPDFAERQQSELEDIEINLLLEGIYSLYGFDFRHYRRSSLRRRILNRMRIENVTSITAFLDKILHEPVYMQRLFEDFSIKVTEMFRDPSFFHAFRQQVIPMIRKYPEIRIWHAGCATGEEVYSMAILLWEEDLLEKTKMYATDMNEVAIERAKKAEIPIKRMQSFTKNYIQAGGTKAFSEYYKTDGHNALFHPLITRNIMFAGHNLVTDGSFNEFHVILCRNVLIYFDTTLQNRVHDLFYKSLSPRGFLGLGQKESIMFAQKAVQYEDFVPAERIFRKI